MSFVKGIAEDEKHVLMLLGTLIEEVRDAFAGEDWQGLRQSHFRVITLVPDEGISVTDLAERVRMTKQGCGQFVTQLVESGHLVTVADPADRRLRVVRRTPLGTRTVRKVARRVARVEDRWRAEVGERRYRTFRAVLDELATREA
ncbi:MarR family winged helix-turn-helix transcriptional regulator [Nocardioides iriomotensis]|uniref:MarR family transcriptional regulator n=1 Tax=Nocardioides iriomotensis TaxID=715784 RepID=A0A4Q5JAC3_9ACTN|nr:MarR family winged helix-turn-helix transcriptional regulator [Nocardioides iriomotensis]RYU15584.1 MarR family transcriptional regulator [Nocardioides iriomotensis]